MFSSLTIHLRKHLYVLRYNTWLYFPGNTWDFWLQIPTQAREALKLSAHYCWLCDWESAKANQSTLEVQIHLQSDSIMHLFNFRSI